MVTLGEVLTFFLHYKYVAIVPLAIVEGPIVSLIVGFLASQSVLNIWVGLMVVFLGDFISDMVFYFIGRKGKAFVLRFTWLKVSEAKIQAVENQYEHAPWKTMILAKASYGLGIPFMVSAGISKMSVQSFVWYMGILNAMRSAILVMTGYYFGRAALEAGQEYLGWYTIGVIIGVPTIWFVVNKLSGKSETKNSTTDSSL